MEVNMNSTYIGLTEEELIIEAISFVVSGIDVPAELANLIGQEVTDNLELVGAQINDNTVEHSTE